VDRFFEQGVETTIVEPGVDIHCCPGSGCLAEALRRVSDNHVTMGNNESDDCWDVGFVRGLSNSLLLHKAARAR
jgi:hypothetical protein